MKLDPDLRLNNNRPFWEDPEAKQSGRPEDVDVAATALPIFATDFALPAMFRSCHCPFQNATKSRSVLGFATKMADVRGPISL